MLKPVYALVGKDVFLQIEALREVMRQAPADVQRIDVDGESAVLADVLDELRSFAMFASHKVLVVRDGEEFVSRFRESLEKYIEKPSPTGTLVLRMPSLPKTQRIYKIIVKAGEIVECEPPKDLAGWIERRAAVHKLKLAREAAALLAELIGSDLGRLDNEILKLALQFDGPVGVEQVNQSATFQREQEMSELTHALAEGDVRAALTRWRQLLQTEQSAEFRAVTWLTMFLEDVRGILVGPFKGAWKYRNNPRGLERFRQTAQRIGRKKLGELIEMLADVDHRSKSGLGEASENVERFLLAVGEG